MKKILSIVLTLALTGCAGGTSTTQILTQSSEEEVMPVSQPIAPAPEPKPEIVSPKPMPKPMVAAKPKPPKKPVASESTTYTIQVIALSHNKGFNDYMNKLPSDKPVWSNKKMVDGLPWYTLLYGEFASKEDAKRALNALPKDIKQFGPFIRSIASIKSSSTPEMTRLN
ncbi:SPOR domain-containing protein [Grimontia hollisae]|uniref:SPOR domain-containing protein n=1 Tax=Grimontia hollisae TaxID=673 RepID=UPI00189CFEE1|nr:SPOR domain-containing protein [Grimontia hollisae]